MGLSSMVDSLRAWLLAAAPDVVIEHGTKKTYRAALVVAGRAGNGAGLL